MSWFERLTTRFIPPAILQEGGERLRRSRLVARIGVILIILSVAPTMLMVTREEHTFVIMNVGLDLLTVAGMLLLRRGKPT